MLTPHICGQHLSGEVTVGYYVTPDTVVMLAPKLVLRGRTFATPYYSTPTPAAPKLILVARPFSLMHSSKPPFGTAKLMLVGGRAVAKQLAIFPSPPDPIIVYPTDEEDFILPPTTEESYLLIPTTERDM